MTAGVHWKVTIGDLRKRKGYIGFNASGACDSLIVGYFWTPCLKQQGED